MRKNQLYYDEEIECPKCKEIIDLENINISVCIENNSIAWNKKDGENIYTCYNCGQKIKVVAHTDISIMVIK